MKFCRFALLSISIKIPFKSRQERKYSTFDGKISTKHHSQCMEFLMQFWWMTISVAQIMNAGEIAQQKKLQQTLHNKALFLMKCYWKLLQQPRHCGLNFSHSNSLPWLWGVYKFITFFLMFVLRPFAYDIWHGFIPKFWLTSQPQNHETDFSLAQLAMIDG